MGNLHDNFGLPGASVLELLVVS